MVENLHPSTRFEHDVKSWPLWNLLDLVEEAGFSSCGDMLKIRREESHLVKASLIHVKHSSPHAYYRVGDEDVIELFYFADPRKWHGETESQMDPMNLKYFCLPNYPYVNMVIELYGSINLDKMFPDKWSDMALRILVCYAEANSSLKKET